MAEPVIEVTCGACHGSGKQKTPDRITCPRCGGDGNRDNVTWHGDHYCGGHGWCSACDGGGSLYLDRALSLGYADQVYAEFPDYVPWLNRKYNPDGTWVRKYNPDGTLVEA